MPYTPLEMAGSPIWDSESESSSRSLPPPDYSPLSRILTPPPPESPVLGFSQRLQHLNYHYLRLEYEIDEATLLLEDAKSEFLKGKPAEMKEETWIADMGILRDEVEYAIDKLKYQHDGLQSQVIALQLEYISTPLPLSGAENRPDNTFETQILYLGALVGKIARRMDWNLRRSWAQIFEVRTGMWGDQFIQEESSLQLESNP